MLTQTHTHIHELVFSLCPYALSGVVLQLCCSQTGLFTAARATRSKQSPPSPPTGRPPINYTYLICTHIHTMSPSVTKLLMLGCS